MAPQTQKHTAAIETHHLIQQKLPATRPGRPVPPLHPVHKRPVHYRVQQQGPGRAVERHPPVERSRRHDALARLVGVGEGVGLVVGQGQEDVGQSRQCRV